MARRNVSRGLGLYAKATTVGNGTLSYEMEANSTVKAVTVKDVLEGIGLLPKIVRASATNLTPIQVTATGSGTSPQIAYAAGSSFAAPNGNYYLLPVAELGATVDAVKISSVTVGPNSGTRLPAEVNFKDGQLFRCDNAMKPTKMKPSAKSPAGLWHDTTDLDFELFTIKGSNTANPARIGVAVRQF